MGWNPSPGLCGRAPTATETMVVVASTCRLHAGCARVVSPDAAGRPYIRVSACGSLTVADSAITDLGTNPFGLVPGEPAISFDRASTGTLSRTSLQSR